MRAVWVRANRLNVVVDDGVVRELPEGQDMIVEFFELPGDKFNSDRNLLDCSASPSIMKLIF
jgi:hypothetical protein